MISKFTSSSVRGGSDNCNWSDLCSKLICFVSGDLECEWSMGSIDHQNSQSACPWLD